MNEIDGLVLVLTLYSQFTDVRSKKEVEIIYAKSRFTLNAFRHRSVLIAKGRSRH